jgi:hypothetical protein
MTSDERELYEERVAIMLAELNPAGMSDEMVELATIEIETAARNEIMRRRQRDATGKKQAGFKWGDCK